MRFIVFEGIDGSGKTTQAKLLHESVGRASISSKGKDSMLRVHPADCHGAPVLTRDPGGTDGALEIRNLIVNGAPDRWSSEVDALLFTAARVANDQKIIKPALAAGKPVICDRYTFSTAVYQGCRMERGAERDRIQNFIWDIHRMTGLSEPDAVFLLDIDPERGLARADSRGGGESRFESFGLEMQKERRAEYLKMASGDPDRFILIDADGTKEEVADRIRGEYIGLQREELRKDRELRGLSMEPAP